jgi:chemotaxis protein methyltransferase CheR/two-component system CheB/CheR fusion protein
MFGMRPQSPSTSLHIAGVGASAGGLEAMLPMFARMQATGRIAYVVAQHMAKDGHDELVVRLIHRESSLPVVLAQSEETLQADTIYVIPSGKDGVVSGRQIVLQEPAPTNISTPSVNTLFSSIAASLKSNGIGIVLSGTGYDGVTGCRALKAQGALTIAQLPTEAKFDGMPTAAIEAGSIDETLPVEAIGPRLAERFPGSVTTTDRKPAPAPSRLAVSPAPTFTAQPSSPVPPSELGQLLKLVHQATGIDFSSYKEDTLLRRLDKRLSTLNIKSLAAYLVHVRQQPDELKTLQQLFLVSVSSFFRDADSFTVLRTWLSRQLAGKPAGEPVRVWVPGCASGEEPYTLAILLKELSGQRPIEIVATDLNPEALEMAAEGVYRQTAFKEMTPALRERYTVPKGQHAEVLPEIRALVRFEKRDVLSGAPVANLDLISCRNLLIYMKSELQDQLIATFHRALHPQGLLFIGQSESLSFVGNSLFVPVDHYHRLFRRRT